ncbi:MAG: allantoicase [Woeseiaceae bacterium]
MDNPFHEWVRLEQPRLGTRVVFATDDFFADKSRLIQAAEPVFIPDKYDDNGKWMDGWESRRKREPGHDYCVVKLGIPGAIHGVDIDTSHFTGNYPPHASIDACVSEEDNPGEGAGWRELLRKVELQGDSHHFHSVDDGNAYTHLRLNIFPDGGIARLRVFGEVRRNRNDLDENEVIDLLALENGGRALRCSDEHFGSMHNLNVPGRGVNMGDGWETARRRGPGNDWVILALGFPGSIEKVEIDTAHFKGNYPDRAAIRATLLSKEDLEDIGDASKHWPILLPESKLDRDRPNSFTDELVDVGVVSHVRMSIHPDGGVSRLRLYGRVGGDGA